MPPNSRRRLFAAIAAPTAVVLAGLGCNRHPTAQGDLADAKRPGRGDNVVVEQTAAQFFEGRVLGASGDQLRVEVPGKSGSVLVAMGDVYRLPAEAHRFSPGDLAICNSARHVWVACRVVQSGATLAVVDAEAHALALDPRAVLAPTAVTELNLQRDFAKNQARAAFAASAATAGAPRAPHGWRPMPRERVLARDGAAWFSARIHELREHEVSVVWDSDRQVSTVEPAAIVPQPPYDTVLPRGAFALMRAVSPSQPWKAVRVRRTDGSEIVVEDVDGAETHTSARDLVPLGIDTNSPPAPK